MRTPVQQRAPSVESGDAATRANAIGEEPTAATTRVDPEGSATKRRKLTSNTTPQSGSLADIPEEGTNNDFNQATSPENVTAQASATPKKRKKKKKSILLKTKRRSRTSLESTTSLDDLPSIAEQEEVHDSVNGLVEGAGDDIFGQEVEDDAGPSLGAELIEEGPSPRAKRKRKKSILLKPKRKSRNSLDSQPADVEAAPIIQETEQRSSERQFQAEARDNDGQDGARSSAAVTASAPITTATSPGKKRKRKSILLPRKKRRSSENDNAITNTNYVESSRSASTIQEKVSEERTATSEKKKRGRPKLSLLSKIKKPLSVSKGNSSLQLPDEQEDLGRTNEKVGSKKTVAQRRSSLSEDDESVENEIQDENEGEQTEEDDADEYDEAASKSTAKPSKISSKPSSTSRLAATKQAASSTIERLKSKLTKSKPTPSTQPRQSKAPRSEKFPVLVQRISHVHRLNFNPDTDDPLSGPGAFPEKPTPNAINVLAQICREVISKNISTLTANARAATSASDKKELLTKRAVIQNYGDNLDGRLFQMSTALDHNYALGVKIRRAEKIKRELREELMEIRDKQAKVDMEMDEMRRVHEEASREADEEKRIEEILGDLEVAVQRGRAAEERQQREGDEDGENEEGEESVEGLLMGLREVAEVASSADGRVGMLDKVKGFNKMLEEAIGKL